MRYEDFVIQLGSSGGDLYVVQVPLAAQGQASGVFRVPFTEDELESLHDSMHLVVRQARRAPQPTRHLRPGAAGASARLTGQEVGARLFRALLCEEIRPIYERELALARRRKHGLRLRLRIDLARPELLRLYNLPWELLYDPGTHDFLGLSRETPVVRYLDVTRPESTIRRPRRLRILAVTAQPDDPDLDPLDLEREVDGLEQRLRGQGGLELVVLRRATREALHRTLRERPFHVLHFMGHGALRAGEGCLVLETPEHRADPIRGATLVQDLKDFGELQLVVLNACDTAVASFEDRTSPFEGVATALVLGGVPAVVGMRYPISDAAALAFSEHFYGRLAAGDPIDAAVAAGRQAIYRLDDESFEWAKPILFLRSQRSEIWPSKAWSRLKKLAGAALVLLLASSLWFLWSQPPVRHYLELHLTADGRMARQVAAGFWRETFTFCGGSAYALVSPGAVEGPDGAPAFYQLKDLGWKVEPVEVTGAARLDGIEYLARSTVRFSSSRQVRAPETAWSAWAPSQAQSFAPGLAIVKADGGWRAEASSPHVKGLPEAGVGDVLAFDCRWLHDGRLDPSKLQAVWASAEQDIEQGNLELAERKILAGLAWLPTEPGPHLLASRLRYAQAEAEADPEVRGRLRRAGYQEMRRALELEAARHPDGAQMLALLRVTENMGRGVCTMMKGSGDPLFDGFLSFFTSDPQFQSALEALRETGVCDE